MGIIILFLDSHVAMFQYWNILTVAFEKETEQQFYKVSLTWEIVWSIQPRNEVFTFQSAQHQGKVYFLILINSKF